MLLSVCDIGNPIYNSSKDPDYGKGIITVQIWFDKGNTYLCVDVDYEYEETPDGYTLTVILPALEFEADDVREDTTQALILALSPIHITEIYFMPQIKTSKTVWK